MSIFSKKGKLMLLKRRDFDKPDAEAEDTTPNVKYYFKLLGRKFWKLISVNMMMLLLILPMFLCFYLYLSTAKTPSENSLLFTELYGASKINSSPAITLLLDLFGSQLQIPAYGYGTYIGMGACLLFVALTFGWQNVGITYLLRSMVRGEPIFFFSDYFYAVKRNFKQGFFVGLFDFLILFVLAFDIVNLWGTTGSFWQDVMFFAICGLSILYFFMRFYLYLLLITFELNLRKLLKNALIFSALGIKRNLMATLGIALITALNVSLFFLFGATPLGVAIPLILPILYYFAVCSFTSAYAAYPIIDRYMIAPFRKENEAESEESEESDESTPADR